MMMRGHLIVLVVFLYLPIFSQVHKGLKPIAKTAIGSGSTYAVVVGISDYQDQDIPDLQFADKDAEAFAGFLQSPAGGNLDEEHLKVLLNEQATSAQFAIALDWLWEVVQENDRVIIYFSGHGDVERKSITQPGYLLCWDAPARVYMAGGAFNVRDLNDVVSTLSVQNKARVLLITDACRAGKLSGSSIGGSQATTANLAKQFTNEIKVLSCQPDEYSIEGKQWGGGRGAFSYHLLNGLVGMADSNSDMAISLREVGRYLEDNVTEEVAPHQQNPMIVGNKTETLAYVFPELLAKAESRQDGQLKLFAAIESRGIETEVLTSVDSSLVEIYLAFQKSIEEKDFNCEASETCAESYYTILSKEPQLQQLHSTMRRNYAAALQDDAQQVLNKILKSNPAENSKSLGTIKTQYSHYPENLRRAADLLGENHYMHNTLLSRSYWFEGYIMDESKCSCPNNPNADRVIPFYQKALEYQPDMPYAWLQLAGLYGIQKEDYATAERYASQAIKALPEWLLAYAWLGKIYSQQMYSARGEEQDSIMQKAEQALLKGLSIDSSSVVILEDLSYIYNFRGQFAKEQEILDRAFAIEPLSTTMAYKGDGYRVWGKYKKAEEAYLQAIKMDSAHMWQPEGLAPLYAEWGQPQNLRSYIDKALSRNLSANTYFMIAEYIRAAAPGEALRMYKRAFEKEPTSHSYLQSIALTESYLEDRDLKREQELWRQVQNLTSKPHRHIYDHFLVYLKMNELDSSKALIPQYWDTYPKRKGSSHLDILYNYVIGDTIATQQAIKRVVERKSIDELAYFAGYTFPRYLPDSQSIHGVFDMLLELYPEEASIDYHYALYFASYQKEESPAYRHLDHAITKGFIDFGRLRTDPHLYLLKRDQKRWTDFLRKHFPDQFI